MSFFSKQLLVVWITSLCTMYMYNSLSTMKSNLHSTLYNVWFVYIYTVMQYISCVFIINYVENQFSWWMRTLLCNTAVHGFVAFGFASDKWMTGVSITIHDFGCLNLFTLSPANLAAKWNSRTRDKCISWNETLHILRTYRNLFDKWSGRSLISWRTSKQINKTKIM